MVTGEMLVAVSLSSLVIAAGVFFLVIMKKEFAHKYTCPSVKNTSPSKINSIGE